MLVTIFFVLIAAVVVMCGGVMRGCSNDIDKANGSKQSFDWWAW